MARSLVVKVTCGAEDAERCNQGFTVSAAAAAAGAEVSLWLTGEAAWFGLPGEPERHLRTRGGRGGGDGESLVQPLGVLGPAGDLDDQ